MEVSTIFPIEDINEQTRRILDFPMFKSSPVLSRFLEFIIFETVHKREIQIKEYSIAIHVLNRSRDFNPTGDSIVRIHAGRLRRALNDYYLTVGIYDPIIITIPKGCYVPEFSESESGKPLARILPVSQEISNKPYVAIFPFRSVTEKEGIPEFLMGVQEQLSEQLLSFHDISVIGYFSDELNAKIKSNVLEAGKLAGADYIITGSLTYIGDHIRVAINLLVTATGVVLLCKSFGKTTLAGNLFELSKDIVDCFNGFSDDCYNIISGRRAKVHTLLNENLVRTY